MSINFDSNSTSAHSSSDTELQIPRRQTTLKRAIGDMQFAVFQRMAEHAGHEFTFNAIADVHWAIRKLCKRSSRAAAYGELSTMPITDVLELSYLLNSKVFFKHISKFSTFYQGLKIKNIKNRHIPIKFNSSNLVPVAKLAIKINHLNINTSAQSNFLLDFGFVESVGSVLLLLKVY